MTDFRNMVAQQRTDDYPAAMQVAGSDLNPEQRADCQGCFEDAAMAAFAGQHQAVEGAQHAR